MKKIFTDFVDNIKCTKLTPKGWNIVATAALVAAGLYWGGCAQYGDFFKVTGCIAYFAAAALWVSKSAWGHKALEFVDQALKDSLKNE